MGPAAYAAEVEMGIGHWVAPGAPGAAASDGDHGGSLAPPALAFARLLEDMGLTLGSPAPDKKAETVFKASRAGG